MKRITLDILLTFSICGHIFSCCPELVIISKYLGNEIKKTDSMIKKDFVELMRFDTKMDELLVLAANDELNIT
jgi:hypothetical protein